jgi:hypothetical protein
MIFLKDISRCNCRCFGLKGLVFQSSLHDPNYKIIYLFTIYISKVSYLQILMKLRRETQAPFNFPASLPSSSVPAVLFLLPCPVCPVPAVLFRLSCSGCPVPVFLSLLSCLELSCPCRPLFPLMF